MARPARPHTRTDCVAEDALIDVQIDPHDVPGSFV